MKTPDLESIQHAAMCYHGLKVGGAVDGGWRGEGTRRDGWRGFEIQLNNYCDGVALKKIAGLALMETGRPLRMRLICNQ